LQLLSASRSRPIYAGSRGSSICSSARVAPKPTRLLGFVIGQDRTLARWNRERRRLRKVLGVATFDDYLQRD
jgi:hypothetical protein